MRVLFKSLLDLSLFTNARKACSRQLVKAQSLHVDEVPGASEQETRRWNAPMVEEIIVMLSRSC